MPLNLRVSPGFLELVREAAALSEIPLSSWMRDRLTRAARRELQSAKAAHSAAGVREKGQGRLFEEGSVMPAGSASETSTRKWIARVREELFVSVSGGGVSEVRMLRGRNKPLAGKAAGLPDPALARRVRKEIDAYLAGRQKAFDLPVDLSSLTPFMRDVLRAAERIPYGETRSYGWVAKEAGRPRAARAVGQALHRNPVPLLIP